MDDILFFIAIMNWIFNCLLVLSGLSVGILIAAGTPPLYRRYRRWSLHRDWCRDIPRATTNSVPPWWDEYDPDQSFVDRRCVCHRRSINPGERVLMWPRIGPGGILHIAVYCETVKESV